MKDIPTIEKNPSGLHQRYTVTKNNGEPVDFFAVYFVLRIDSGGRDWAHIGACRAAARAYVEQIRKEEDASHMQQTADELEALLDRLEPGWTIEPHGNGYALYSGRGPMAHGMNLVYMSEPDSNWEATKRLIESVPAMVRALKAIVNHQDMMGGELAKMSTTRHIAAKAIMDATGEVV